MGIPLVVGDNYFVFHARVAVHGFLAQFRCFDFEIAVRG